jgi:hypothetical protein
MSTAEATITLPNLIHQAIEELDTDDPQVVAEHVLATAPREVIEAHLVNLIRWRASMSIRQRTRTVERRVISRTGGNRTTTVSDMAELVDKTFSLPDGRRVSWGEATIEDHQARAFMLRELAERTMITATQHERAAEMISTAGAACLNDIVGGEKAAA